MEHLTLFVDWKSISVALSTQALNVFPPQR